MHTTDTPARPPAYPLPRPPHDDQRFTIGLVLQIAEVLTTHGYPPIATSSDLLRWQNALFTTIYQTTKENS